MKCPDCCYEDDAFAFEIDWCVDEETGEDVCVYLCPFCDCEIDEEEDV